MKLLTNLMKKKSELQIAPLIDVVFLLLVYFMVTASLIRKEADLSFLLPTPSPSTPMVDYPLEVLVEISTPGEVMIEGTHFAQQEDLIGYLMTLKASAEASGSEMVVNILPADKALHRDIVPVMDACAAADVKNMSFSAAM